jgi:anti-sigma factor RsiW
MNREEAKLILQVFRSSGADLDDPQFAEALALAKSDSELAAWFADQQKFDALAARAITSAPVPLDLKAKILASVAPAPEKTIEQPVLTWWQNIISLRSPVAWAMAAVIVALLSLVVFWSKPVKMEQFADYRAAMIRASANEIHHVDMHNDNLGEVEAWLAAHHALTNFNLPLAMRHSSGLNGCRVLDWHGQMVSMLCFSLDGSKHVDLFVAKLTNLANPPPLGRPEFAQVGQRATASWSAAGKVYLMVGQVDEQFLRECLQHATVRNNFPTMVETGKNFLQPNKV